MAKPALYPWATDDGATADPGPARQATGFLAGTKAPAKWFNFLHARAHAWQQYVNNLHGEAEFLNKDYSWVGSHTWGGLGAFRFSNLLRVQSLQCDTDANLVNLIASGDVFAGGRVRASGSLGLQATTGDARVSGDYRHCDVNGAIVNKSRVCLLPLSSAGPSATWTTGGAGGVLVCSSASGIVEVPLPLVTGSVLKRVRVGYKNGTPAGSPVAPTFSIYRQTPDTTDPVSPGALNVEKTATGTTDASAIQIIDTAAFTSTVVARSTDVWFMRLIASNSTMSPAQDTIHWIEITFDDPGPRNY